MGDAPFSPWDKMLLTGNLLAPSFDEVDAYISYTVRLFNYYVYCCYCYDNCYCYNYYYYYLFSFYY